MKPRESLFLIIMSGVPGSGKSTLARELSRKLKLALVDLDDLKHSSIRDTFRQGWVAYDTLFKLVECQLSNGINVIIDTCLTYYWTQERILLLAKQYKAIPIILLCKCSEEIAHLRIKDRWRAGKQLDCTIEKYEILKRVFNLNYEVCDLILDTETHNIDNCVERMLECINNLSHSFLRISNPASVIENIINNKILNLFKQDSYTTFYSKADCDFADLYISNGTKIEISNGEIIDRFTILLIKLKQIKKPSQIINIRKQYFSLFSLVNSLRQKFDLDKLGIIDKLLEINMKLWDIEDKIREKEHHQEFDKEFIELARNIYCLNDQRSEIKLKINLLTNSIIVEEKQYFNDKKEEK